MTYLFYQSNHWLFSGFWLKESLNIKETRLSGDFEPIVENGPDKTSFYRREKKTPRKLFRDV